MAERTAEFKLFLVFQGDRLGLQPEALEQMSETLAVQAVHKAQMTDYRDWRSLLSAYGSIDTADLARVIAK
jgi:prophage maintenance system killer protein